MVQINAFTIDVEDYFQVTAFERHVDRRHWDKFPHRVVGNTERLLDLLAEHGVRGTFYVLGWVADRYPAIVRRMAAEGHQLGSHSYWHRLVYHLTPHEFRDDLRRSKKVIEDVAGICVETYRAPSFSITSQSKWALEILVEEGFTSDSSVFPIRHHRYGIPNANVRFHRLYTPAGPLWELPPSVVRCAGVNIPVAGGGYFRLYPFRLTAQCLRGINRSAAPFMFYVHPWEVDPEQQRLPYGSFVTRFRHYVNLKSTHAKLSQLLHEFRFGRVSDVLGSLDLLHANFSLPRQPDFAM